MTAIVSRVRDVVHMDVGLQSACRSLPFMSQHYHAIYLRDFSIIIRQNIIPRHICGRMGRCIHEFGGQPSLLGITTHAYCSLYAPLGALRAAALLRSPIIDAATQSSHITAETMPYAAI